VEEVALVHWEVVAAKTKQLLFEIVTACSRSNSSIIVLWLKLEIKITNDAATP
jgi:hypothetical protein